MVKHCPRLAGAGLEATHYHFPLRFVPVRFDNFPKAVKSFRELNRYFYFQKSPDRKEKQSFSGDSGVKNENC